MRYSKNAQSTPLGAFPLFILAFITFIIYQYTHKPTLELEDNASLVNQLPSQSSTSPLQTINKESKSIGLDSKISNDTSSYYKSISLSISNSASSTASSPLSYINFYRNNDKNKLHSDSCEVIDPSNGKSRPHKKGSLLSRRCIVDIDVELGMII